MKNKRHFGLQVVIVIAVYFMLSLACVSAPSTPQQYERQVAVDVITLNKWLVNYEEKITVANGLTSAQLMEVTKLCLASGELKDLYVVQESEVLSFAILESAMEIDGAIVKFKFNYSISNSGILKMKVTEVYEDVPGTFRKAVGEGHLEMYKTKVLDKFKARLQNIADTVIKRSADFV